MTYLLNWRWRKYTWTVRGRTPHARPSKTQGRWRCFVLLSARVTAADEVKLQVMFSTMFYCLFSFPSVEYQQQWDLKGTFPLSSCLSCDGLWLPAELRFYFLVKVKQHRHDAQLSIKLRVFKLRASAEGNLGERLCSPSHEIYLPIRTTVRELMWHWGSNYEQLMVGWLF